MFNFNSNTSDSIGNTRKNVLENNFQTFDKRDKKWKDKSEEQG